MTSTPTDTAVAEVVERLVALIGDDVRTTLQLGAPGIALTGREALATSVTIKARARLTGGLAALAAERDNLGESLQREARYRALAENRAEDAEAERDRLSAQMAGLEELRALSEAATAGRWQNGIEDFDGIVAPDVLGIGNVICLPPLKRMYSSLDAWSDNAAFIVAAVSHVRTALTALKGQG